MREPALSPLHLREVTHLQGRRKTLRVRAVEGYLHPPRLAGEKVEEVVREGRRGRVGVQPHEARIDIRADLDDGFPAIT